MARLFGTDGVRGVANKQLTPEMAFHLGQAGAYVLSKEHPHPRIIIGKDTRISGDMLEAALVSGICSVGADVLRVGVLPTPGIAYLTRTMDVSAGVVISASHNPVQDNGIKFFSSSGYKLPDEVEDEIETIVNNDCKPWDVPVGEEVGRVIEVPDAGRRYLSFLKEAAPPLDGLRIVLDCANGAGSLLGPMLLGELGAEVLPIFNTPDGVNINDGCGSTHPQALQKAVVECKADLGLACDGDADRLIAVDEKGNIIDGDFIMLICALDLKAKGLLAEDTLVVTVMSNLGLRLALQGAGIRVLETQVGDRYVLEELLRSGAKLGGEQSGHIIFLNHNTTGDGLLTALQLLRVVKEKNLPLSLLAAQMRRLPQVLLNTKVRHKERLMADGAVRVKVGEVTAALNGEGRVLVRPSGTEPLIRVMVEGPEERLLRELAQSLIEVIRSRDLLEEC
ncbi:phosphoglucosamine mutase [Acididesulfobacillus acetoxydans]|uniref:Phosphoglucosamine mutase n=1 Tax=Acididesulfobacillus acetoxydans TaxID=1561005 RepID=A0A8S0WEQ4_9FIRM|nr:phosphoglucosamine mutase [Acididesulfobacillus acetoxydans]CAA7600352.1 phosphoglucosamine mutase [Acididesulfobacillus acetoxydans]CEJ07874.1 Phosphoglucosamine mutase [Acididesulfobacillus acetoxydans]